MWQMILEYTAMFLISAGVFFLLVGNIGLIRLPDVYTRMHAVGKSDTLGCGLILTGLMFAYGSFDAAIKLLVILALVGIINPTVTHMMAKVSYERGMELAEGSFVLNTYTATMKKEDLKEKEGHNNDDD